MLKDAMTLSFLQEKNLEKFKEKLKEKNLKEKNLEEKI
jgi:hypothetical protein